MPQRDNWKWTRRTFKLLITPFIAAPPLFIYDQVAQSTHIDSETHRHRIPTLREQFKEADWSTIGGLTAFSLVIPTGCGGVGLTKWGYNRYQQRKLRRNRTRKDSLSNTATNSNSSGT